MIFNHLQYVKNFSFGLVLLLTSCSEPATNYPKPPQDTTKSFTAITEDYSGIDFNNELDSSDLKSPLESINVFNGGGVSVGDINNDGLIDVYFTGNLSDNKLFINKGGFVFEDITLKAGVASPNSWSTGATIVDINNDGYLDIYVCRSYHDRESLRENQLFINNGDETFTERAAEYGLNDNGYSITATFFDYDKDGRMDVFVGNHPPDRLLSYEQHYDNWLTPRMETSNHLYRNEGEANFVNTTGQAALLSYGWTLGAVTADFNGDDWPDIYVTVDHTEPDRLYYNNRNGTFSEVSKVNLKHMSQSSMGVDAGDINNDGFLDVVTAEMLAADNFRAKTQMQNMDVDRFWDFVRKDHNYQYMRNMLHVNNGNGTFREVGQMAKIHKTDWSWSTLFMDMDNDGWQDLYISNGYFKDYSDQDYRIDYNEKIKVANESGNNNEKLKLLRNHSKDAKSTKLPNYMFQNNGDYTFKDVSASTGLDFKGFSNGAAYADFDNDGDLDIVVNNINDVASLYSNNASEQAENNWLRIKFDMGNKHAFGAKVTVKTNDGIQFREHTITRGYQSSVEDAMHFGIGKNNTIKEVNVKWPDGKTQILDNIEVNKVLTLKYSNAESTPTKVDLTDKLFQDVTNKSGLNFNHQESYFNDYDKQVLLPHQMSCFGPAFAKGDVNGDGFEDVFFGGAQNQQAAIYLQNSSGIFIKSTQPDIVTHASQEDLGGAFFDVDGDGDLDLYVTSGGNEMPNNDSYYLDRFYLNDGAANFKYAPNIIPRITQSGSVVKPFDFDKDGDLDVFVGSRHTPGAYPFAPKSYLLENQNGKLRDVTKSKAPALLEIGMVTDALWTDANSDGDQDLMVVGEWMPLSFLIQTDGNFKNETEAMGLSKTSGWWNCINALDIDGDGDTDYALGNLGTNYKYQASIDKPFHIYADDFDSNGSMDIALGYENNNTLFPVRGKECSTEQIPGLTKKFQTYEAFGNATLRDVYGDKLNEALHYEINTFKSSILMNNGANFQLKPMPMQAQSSPVNGIVSKDFDGDGHIDLLMAGNLHISEVETGRADSGIGFFLKGDGNGDFETQFANESGFFARGDVKHLETVKTANGEDLILVVKNNNDLQVTRN